MTSSVLFLIFNRPDLTEISFARIREAQPRQLFVAADGPRAEFLGEADHCKEARRIAEQVDWPCDVNTLYQDQNLGCRAAVSAAITWFFEHVEEGIILEDDCVPNPDFFPFCAELLERYRNDERIMCITGNNFRGLKSRSNESYYYSIYNHCWGWASWRRAWTYYDRELSQWPNLNNSCFLNGFLSEAGVSYWSSIFDSVYAGNVDTWDYQWTFSCWANSGLTVTPNVNLVSNIGFDERATHTTDKTSNFASLRTGNVVFPLLHPTSVQRNFLADQQTEKKHFGIRTTTAKPTILHRFLSRTKRFARRAKINWTSIGVKKNSG